MTTIKLKNGSGAPTSGDLAQGEPALDLTNKRLYTEDSGGTVIEVGTNPGASGAVTLNHSGSTKLATTSTGIDVTGTVVSNGLTLENNAEYLSVKNSSGSSTRAFGVNAANNLYIGGIDADIGPILFVDNGATLATLGPTGIDVTGTVTADGLTVNSGAENLVATFQSTDTEAQIALVDTTGTSTIRARNDFRFHVNNAATPALKIDSNNDISFYEDTGTTAKLFWDASAESLGIGTSSPDSALVVQGGQGTYAQIKDGTVTTLLQARGQDSIGVVGTLSNHGFGFFTNSTERMRIDSSGNLLVGKTYTAASIAGQELRAGGYTAFTRSGGNPLELNRLTSDGTIVNFSKDGTSVGSIATTSSRLSIGSNDVGLFFDSTNERFTPIDQTNQTDRDAAIDLGYASSRFKDLHLSGTPYIGGTSAGQSVIQMLANPTNGANTIHFGDSASGSDTYAGYINYAHDSNSMQFATNQLERMRLDSSGNLLVGTTTQQAKLTVEVNQSSSFVGHFKNSNGSAYGLAVDTGSGQQMYFYLSGAYKGGITSNASGTSYNTSSDQRLKENIVDAPSASDDIDAIQVRSFDWKADGSHQKYGMVAQELQSVAPEAVSEGATEEDMMGVDYSKLVPMLVKEIQSLRARVAQLEGAN